MSSFTVKVINDASRSKDLSGAIEIVAKDGKVSAKRCPLQMASPIMHNLFMDSPDTKIVDFENHKTEVIEGLLDLVNNGESASTDERLRAQVVNLAKELGISFQTSQTYTEVKTNSEEPEEQKFAPELVDTGLIKMENGKVMCKICFKVLAQTTYAREHYRNVHLANKSQRNIPCRSPGCDKMFYLSTHMKSHLRSVHGISAKTLEDKAIPSFKVTLNKDALRVKHLPHDIEILARGGKIIAAKRCPLQLASGVWNKFFVENPDSTILDLKNYKKEVIEGLLQLMYQGEMTFNEEEYKDEVVDLAEELEIKVKTEFSFKRAKTDAPKKAPKLYANEDYCLIPSEDGRYQCTICFKILNNRSNGKRHYEDIHLTNNSVKNVQCRAPDCGKKYSSTKSMHEHMRKRHANFWKYWKSANLGW